MNLNAEDKARLQDMFTRLSSGDHDFFHDPYTSSCFQNQRISKGSREERIAHHLKCVRDLESQETQAKRRASASSCTSCYSFERKTYSSSEISIAGLQQISIKDLRVGQVHRSKVLYCRVITRSSFLKSVQTIVEDADGNIADLAVYNAPRISSISDAQRYLAEGRLLGIKEPFYKLRADGTEGIRVDDPTDIVLDVGCPAPLVEEVSTVSAEERLLQLISADSGIGQKRLRELLHAEGYSMSQKRVREILARVRSESEEARIPTLPRGSEPLPTFEETDLAIEEERCPPLGELAQILPNRCHEDHRSLQSVEVREHRDAGNAAVKEERFADAEKQYKQALKASEKEKRGMRAEGAEGVALWTLYSNRSAARMHLKRPDEALLDALAAHMCAPANVVKPILRCAEAMEALCMHQSVEHLLQAAAAEFPAEACALLHKQRSLAPKAILRVGQGQTYCSIRAAVEAAPPGAEILVSPGIYRESLRLSRPITIRSVDAIEPNEHWVHQAPGGEMVEIWTRSFSNAVSINAVGGSVCLQGLRVICEAPLECSLHAVEALGGVVVLRKCSLSSTSGPIVAADHGARVIAEHCAIHDGAQGGIIAANDSMLALSFVYCCRAAASGLELRAAGKARVSQSTFSGNGGQGILLWHGAGSFEARHSEIHSNVRESGVLVEDNIKPAVFKACKMYGNGFAGAVAQRKGTLRLSGCEVHSNCEGILLQDSGNGIIETCHVFDNRANGIFVGYDHVGTAEIVGNKVCKNHMKGILLGTGLCKNITLRENDERDNRGLPVTSLPPTNTNVHQRAMDARQWAKNVKKSGGGFAKSAGTSADTNLHDYVASIFGKEFDAMQNQANEPLFSCGYCKKPAPEKRKFLKCSKCQLVSYCSPKCQTAHWQAGHKAECSRAPAKYPSFVDQNRSVDDRYDGCAPS